MMMKKYFLLFLAASLSFTCMKAQTGTTQPTLKDQFTKRIGNLRLSISTLAFGKVKSNELRQDTIRIMNAGKNVLNLAVQSRPTSYYNVILSTTKLEVEEVGWIIISYDFSKRGDYGFILDRILINTNDIDQPQKNINITATILEYFSMSDSLNPKARIPETIYNYESIHAGEKVKHDFLIYNDGTKPLIIRKAKSTCGCIKANVTKSEIPIGESGIIHVEFDSFGKDGKDSRIINVYLNDPQMSEVNLEFAGTVLK